MLDRVSMKHSDSTENTKGVDDAILLDNIKHDKYREGFISKLLPILIVY